LSLFEEVRERTGGERRVHPRVFRLHGEWNICVGKVSGVCSLFLFSFRSFSFSLAYSFLPGYDRFVQRDRREGKSFWVVFSPVFLCPLSLRGVFCKEVRAFSPFSFSPSSSLSFLLLSSYLFFQVNGKKKRDGVASRRDAVQYPPWVVARFTASLAPVSPVSPASPVAIRWGCFPRVMNFFRSGVHSNFCGEVRGSFQKASQGGPGVSLCSVLLMFPSPATRHGVGLH
jgi:hypothetical protein